MRLLSEQKNISWAPLPNIVRLLALDEMPEVALCSSAYVLAFEGDKILMADLDRGVDIPGGHIDEGETPYQAMRRETHEETGAKIQTAQLFCAQHIQVTCAKPENYRYPYPESYQLMYVSSDFIEGDFVEDEDSNGPLLLSEKQVMQTAWYEKNTALYHYARDILSL